MVSKLAMIRAVNMPEGETADRLIRDEIQQVIVDTELLVTGQVPLERWLEGARDR